MPTPYPSKSANLLLALSLCLAASCAEQLEPTAAGAGTRAGVLTVLDPQFPETPDELDLGHVLFGEIVARTVKLRNDSDEPLTIRNIRPGCSCTTPALSYEDLLPTAEPGEDDQVGMDGIASSIFPTPMPCER